MLKMKVVDLGSVLTAVKEVEESVGDDERAHILEDELHRAVLGLAAHGHPQTQLIAQAAMSTLNLGFKRQCS